MNVATLEVRRLRERSMDERSERVIRYYRRGIYRHCSGVSWEDEDGRPGCGREWYTPDWHCPSCRKNWLHERRRNAE